MRKKKKKNVQIWGDLATCVLIEVYFFIRYREN